MMVSEAWFGVLDGASCEAAVACIFPYEGFVERGLVGFPGGDESELVKGVRACRDIGWPGRDIVVGVERKWTIRK